jgi:hypothetical protein
MQLGAGAGDNANFIKTNTSLVKAWCVRGGSGYDGGVISPHP